VVVRPGVLNADAACHRGKKTESNARLSRLEP
jgi:hypothetical protein